MSDKMIDRIRTKQLHPGAWLSLGHPVIMEMAVLTKVEWILLDMEHGYTTEDNLLNSLIASKNTEVPVVVRIGKFDPSLISRILDWGASGIMLPHVNNSDDACRCLEAMYYPPDGKRGFSASARCFDYDLAATRDNAKPKPLFFAQIESEEAVKNINEIAGLEGVDVLFIGPSDLKMDYSAHGKDESTFEQAVEKIISASDKYGKQVGIVTKSLEDFNRYARLGITCITFGSDLQFLKKGFRDIAAIKTG